MCTLIVAHHVFSGFPIVVAANRDELLDRPSEPPMLRDEQRGIVAPKDIQRGGSWIGVNKSGLLIGLTNRVDVTTQSGRMSRGEIVMRALQYDSACHALTYLRTLKGEAFNGFHLVAVDADDLFLLKGDGKTIDITTEPTGLLVVSNQGCGRSGDSAVSPRVANVLYTWKHHSMHACSPTPANLVPLLSIHDKARFGTCINEPDNNYGTKSSSVICSDGLSWQYWHRERTSFQRHICTDQFGSCMTISIRP
jgi:hypothetical protein